ncbi:MAG: FkbM family methyltransferase [Clostridiales bacterium]|jgi:FkbM family methyltransferase|nr:FkbM family methyltransferase [Eubacteriales bacterium]MDH7567792.1 FkbM family methyltransferase [Clostridiales bacterium]
MNIIEKIKNRINGDAARKLIINLKLISQCDFSNMSGIISFFCGYKAEMNYRYKQIRRKYYDSKKNIYNFNGVKIPDESHEFSYFFEDLVFAFDDIINPMIFKKKTYIEEGPYEDENVVVTEGDIVFDCGANMGIFSAVAAARRCKVYAFEPVPKTLQYLLKTAEMNENIEICPFALTDRNTDILITVPEEHAGGSSFVMNRDGKNVIVKGITLDSFVKENNIMKVDFIKTDIEGAERYLLMGAKEILSKFSPKLSICTYHLPDDPEVLEKLIKEANPNYIIKQGEHKLYAYVPK